MSTRQRLLSIFLWMAVCGWGVGLGAKLFDLVVLGAAWGAAPPASLALLPYGSRYPINPGDFFQPLSAIMAIGIVGALICGWKSARPVRLALWLGVIAFAVIWAITPTVFWPMINALYDIATGKVIASDATAHQLVRRWILWDSFRVGLIAVGFIASVRALSLSAVRGDAGRPLVENRIAG